MSEIFCKEVLNDYRYLSIWNQVRINWSLCAEMGFVQTNMYRDTKCNRRCKLWSIFFFLFGALHKLCRLKICNFWPIPTLFRLFTNQNRRLPGGFTSNLGGKLVENLSSLWFWIPLPTLACWHFWSTNYKFLLKNFSGSYSFLIDYEFTCVWVDKNKAKLLKTNFVFKKGRLSKTNTCTSCSPNLVFLTEKKNQNA